MTVYVKYGDHAALELFHEINANKLLVSKERPAGMVQPCKPSLHKSKVLQMHPEIEHRRDIRAYRDRLCDISEYLHYSLTAQQPIIIPQVEGLLELRDQQYIVSDFEALFPTVDFILTTMSPVVVASSPRKNVRWLDWCKSDEMDELFEREVPFAAGATLQRVLIELFALPERVPSAMTDVVSEYGRTQSPEALALIEQELGWDEMVMRVDADNTRKRLLRDWSNRNAAAFHVDQLFSSWVAAACPGAVSVVRHRNMYQFRDYDNPIRLLTNAECRAYEAFCALWNEAARLQGE